MKIYNISMMTTSTFSTGKQILDHFLQGSRYVFCTYMMKKHAIQYSLSQNFSLFKKLFNYVAIIKTSMFLSMLIVKFTEKEVFIIIFYKSLQL